MSYKILLILIKNCKNTWYDLNHGLGIPPPPQKKTQFKKTAFHVSVHKLYNVLFRQCCKKIEAMPRYANQQSV